MTLTIHPDLQSLIPPLTSEEFAQLEANIVQDGCRDPLTVWQEKQVLLDGHNRQTICTTHGLPYTMVEISLPDLAAAQAWMVANQLGRRNLTPEQMSYFRGKQYELQKQMGFKGNQHTNAAGKSYQKQDTAQALARQHHVAEKTIRNDAAFAKAVDTLADSVGPDARQAILARDAKVTQKDVTRLAILAKQNPQTITHVFEAVQAAKTPKQAKQIVQQAVQEEKQLVVLGQHEGDSHGEEMLATWETLKVDQLARRLKKALSTSLISLDELYDTLVEINQSPLSLHDALASHTEIASRIGQSYQHICVLVRVHPDVFAALAPEAPVPVATPAPAPAPAAAQPRTAQTRKQRILAVAKQLKRFTSSAMAQRLGDNNKYVWRDLQELVKQGTLTQTGQEYQYKGTRTAGTRQHERNQKEDRRVLDAVEKKINAGLKKLFQDAGS